MGRKGKAAGFWFSKPEGKSYFRRDDNIKMDLKQLHRKDVGSILAYERDKRWAFVNTAMNIRVP
jgi:hypothetical protein